MDIELLTGPRIEKILAELMSVHEEYYWNVAWGSLNSVSEKLIEMQRKIKRVVFGLAFAQTDPRLIKKLIDVPGCYALVRVPNGIFHPKVYAFRSKGRAAAIIGSANFTAGGFEKNVEACTLVLGSEADKFFEKLFQFLEASSLEARPIEKNMYVEYERAHKILSARRPPVRDPISYIGVAGSPRILDMSWSEYIAAVKRSEHHNIAESLDLLRTIQGWFSIAPSFSDLDVLRRKAIAGTLGTNERDLRSELDRDWGWFGSMRGAGEFASRILSNDLRLAAAIDSIPSRGDVTREDYETFVQFFTESFADAQRRGGVATASRLLAMKRPDTFICICGPNRAKSSAVIGFTSRNLDFEKYWIDIIEVIRASKWYNTKKPTTLEGQIWDFRAAMLDTIFYEPI